LYIAMDATAWTSLQVSNNSHVEPSVI